MGNFEKESKDIKKKAKKKPQQLYNKKMSQTCLYISYNSKIKIF